MKRFKKLLIALSGLALSVGAAVGVGLGAEKNASEAKADDPFMNNLTIYVDKTNVNWMDLHVYHWEAGQSGTFSAMTQVSGNFYKYSIPSNTAGIIINHTNGWIEGKKNCQTSDVLPSYLFQNGSMSNLIILGSQPGDTNSNIGWTLGFYLENPTTDNNWYITGEFNDWDKNDPKYHLKYKGIAGNNWEYETDFVLTLQKGKKFNIVYTWDDTHYYTYAPNLAGDVSTSSFTKTDNYFTPNNDIVAKFYYQIYENKPSWTGLYTYAYNEPSASTDDDKDCLESWAYDFMNITKNICNGTDRDNEAALSAVWCDSTITSNTSNSIHLAGTFNGWNTTALPFFETSTSGVYKIIDFFLLSSDELKVVDGSWYPDGDNIAPGVTGYYTITYTRSSHAVQCTKQSCQYLKTSYNRLYDSAKQQFVAGNTREYTALAYTRYVHIINRYENLDNFASLTVTRNRVVPPSVTSTGSSNNSLIAVLVSSVIALLAVGGYFFLRRKADR